MKKAIALTLLTAMLSAALLAGCGAEAEVEETPVGMANPMTECSLEDMMDEIGIQLQAPDGASDVVYYTISIGDGDVTAAIAEMDFTLDGVNYTHRALAKDQADLEEVAGTYFTDAKDEGVMVSNCDGALYTGDGMAAVIWWDRVPGITYTLSTSGNEDGDTLLQVAEKTYLPLQGDSE